MSNWNDEQAGGEQVLRKWQQQDERDRRLCDFLRASGITADDMRYMLVTYGLLVPARVRNALSSLEEWLKEGS